MSEHRSLMPEEYLPRVIYRPHDLPNGNLQCPDTHPPLDIELTRLMRVPVYSCQWRNPLNKHTCRRKFDIKGDEIRVG